MITMTKDSAWTACSGVCAIVCVICPIAIAYLGHNYGFDRLDRDEDYQEWPGYAVDALFWIALFATVGCVVSMRRWWWLPALVLLPLLAVTAALAVTVGMWMDGTYF
jgi:hypothetical protein